MSRVSFYTRPYDRLEPYDGKLSRTVLRGGAGSNASLLPDIRSEKDILKLVKLQLEDKVDWDISTYTLSGTTDMQDCFTTGFPLSVLVPDESSVAAARRMIRELING